MSASPYAVEALLCLIVGLIVVVCILLGGEHPDERVLWFREGQFNAEEILSGEACKVSLRDPPGSVKPLLLWSRSADFPRFAGFMIGDASHFRRILTVTKEGDNVIYEVGPYQEAEDSK